MKQLLALLLLAPASLLAQTWLSPYHLGEFRHDTIFEFTYIAPDNCGGFDIRFDASQIAPFAEGMSLHLDILGPANVDGIYYDEGASFDINENVTAFDIFYGPIFLPLQVRVVGVPLLEGQEIPCWVDMMHSSGLCSDTLTLVWGESFAPCFVEPPTGVEKPPVPSFSATAQDGVLNLHSDVNGQLDIIDIAGRILHTTSIEMDERMVLDVPSGIIIARLTGATGTFSQKIFIH
jgi:hypothetical protein